MEIIRKTESVCPKCGKVIPAVLIDNGKEIVMEKTCPKHGIFREICYGTEQFKKLNCPANSKKIECSPYECQKCTTHMTGTMLAVIDVTNRCNLRCKYCFARADKVNYLYEPSLEKLKEMLAFLKKKQPDCTSVLFSGGEPTMRDDLPDIVKLCREMGFEVRILATNGYRIANDLEYTKKIANEGLYLLYLSFDGLTDETNTEKKNHLIIDKIMNNCRKTGIEIILVPTVGRSNCHEAFKIIQFAAKNADVIRGVNFQPISFCFSSNPEHTKNMRYNISDLCSDVEKQSKGLLKESDFYPVPAIVPFQKAINYYYDMNIPLFTVHPLCGRAAYLFLDEQNNIIPLSTLMDIPKVLQVLEKFTKLADEKNNFDIILKKAQLTKEIKDTIKWKNIYHNKKAISLFFDIITKHNYEALTEFQKNAIFIGMMHFMDTKNMDLERLRRCGIHYLTPEPSLIPFCAYNNLGYRENIEKQFSVSYNEQT